MSLSREKERECKRMTNIPGRERDTYRERERETERDRERERGRERERLNGVPGREKTICLVKAILPKCDSTKVWLKLPNCTEPFRGLPDT